MAEANDIVRCPCGSQVDLPHSQEHKAAWIQCDSCDNWQHSICVGIPEDKAVQPKHYFCEQCKPQHHKRFNVNPSSDNRLAIAEERQEMHKMMLQQQTRKDKDASYKTRATWLIDEIMAIVDGHPEALDAAWAHLSGMSDPSDLPWIFDEGDMTELSAGEKLWMTSDFEENVRLSIRTVLDNATVSALEGFRVRLVKVRFSEHEVVTAELWSLSRWLDPVFMKKMESLGQVKVDLVRRYFNM